MSITRALTGEEVFLIADPPVSLRSVAESSIPNLKVDLKARLAMELNRQIVSESGKKRELLKKQLKRLMMDKMTKLEEKKLLDAIVPIRAQLGIPTEKVIVDDRLVRATQNLAMAEIGRAHV